MSTLLLRLAGPLQAWGSESKFEVRRTGREPTKSGVIGLIASALGCRRDDIDTVEKLDSLRMGIRIDQPGELLRDYHTAHRGKDSYVTSRFYLSDAVFLVGLESDDEQLLSKLEGALRNPAFPLFLGRRSCPPTLPLVLGIRSLSLGEALEREPWQAAEWRRRKLDGRLRIIEEGVLEDGVTYRLRDRPLSFNPTHRQYGFVFWTERRGVDMKAGTSHDAMHELMGGEDDVPQQDRT